MEITAHLRSFPLEKFEVERESYETFETCTLIIGTAKISFFIDPGDLPHFEEDFGKFVYVPKESDEAEDEEEIVF